MPEGAPAVLPLVVVSEDGIFAPNEEALEHLSSLDGDDGSTDLTVAVIGGKYRQGKSSLWNWVAGHERGCGFGVGDTVKAKTKGIWMSKVLLPMRDDAEGTDAAATAAAPAAKRNVLFLDTEGISSLDADSDHDIRILTLALLLSSVFVYNSVGPIDEAAVQTLSLLGKVSALVDKGAGASREATFPDLFPSFVWILRDMNLRMEGERGEALTSDQYMEEALSCPSPSQASAADAATEGAVLPGLAARACIRDTFPKRKCLAFPRPVDTDSRMAGLSQLPCGRGAFTSRFEAQLEQLKTHLLSRSSSPPLRYRSANVTPRMFVALVRALTQAVNGKDGKGIIPSLRDSWSLLSELRAKDAHAEALSLVRARLADALSLSPTESALEDGANGVVEAALLAFDARLIAPDPALRQALKREAERLAKDAVAEVARQRAEAARRDAAAAVADLDFIVRQGAPLSEALRRGRQEAPFALDSPCSSGARFAGSYLAAAFWREAVLEKLEEEWLPEREAEAEKRGTSLAAAAEEATASAARIEAGATAMRAKHAADIEAALQDAALEKDGEVERLRMLLRQKEEEAEANAAHVEELEERVVVLSSSAAAAQPPLLPPLSSSPLPEREPAAPASAEEGSSPRSSLVSSLEASLAEALAAKAEKEAQLRSDLQEARDRLTSAEAGRDAVLRRVAEAEQAVEAVRQSFEEKVRRLARGHAEQARSAAAALSEAQEAARLCRASEQEARRAVADAVAERDGVASLLAAAKGRNAELEERIHAHVEAQVQASRKREEAVLKLGNQRMQDRISFATSEREHVAKIASLETEVRCARKRVGEHEASERETRSLRRRTFEAEAELSRLAAERDFEARRKEEIAREREDLRAENGTLLQKVGGLERENELMRLATSS